jgi:hypothetical protein
MCNLQSLASHLGLPCLRQRVWSAQTQMPEVRIGSPCLILDRRFSARAAQVLNLFKLPRQITAFGRLLGRCVLCMAMDTTAGPIQISKRCRLGQSAGLVNAQRTWRRRRIERGRHHPAHAFVRAAIGRTRVQSGLAIGPSFGWCQNAGLHLAKAEAHGSAKYPEAF